MHIELQVKAERDLGERLAEYGIRLWRRDHLPVRSVVVFLRRRRTLPRSPFAIDWMGERVHWTSFEVVRLWQIPAERVLETPHVELWPLAGLMAGMSAQRVMATGERLAAAPVGEEQRRELLGLLVLLAGQQVPAAALAEAVRSHPMIEELLRQSPMIEELLRQSSMATLIRAEGRTEGRAEGLRLAARLALEGRFGSLDADLVAAIERAGADALQELLLHIGSDTLPQVRARLNLP